jgi:hypothetical protein
MRGRIGVSNAAGLSKSGLSNYAMPRELTKLTRTDQSLAALSRGTPMSHQIRLTKPNRFVFAAVLIAFATAGLPSQVVRAGDFSIADSKGKHLDIIAPSGKPLLRYVYGRDTSTPELTFDTAKIFAHVIAPNGKTTLTKGPGGKYPHHRGIFIGWSKLKHDGKSHDLWHVRNTAQLHQKFGETKADSNGASITSSIFWVGNHEKTVIEEQRTYTVVAQEGAYAVVDFTSELKAANGDVELNGDPEHAGIQFRPSQQVAENKSAKYLFHGEGIDPKKNQDLPWAAVSFLVDDEAWTVQQMSHPSNPKGARWSAYRDYGRFGPFTVVKIADGKTQTFRYRFRVTKGDAPTREALAKQYANYAK